ncbi:disulfide bond formation protein DsbA [Oleiharenicola lentus]|uniref:Disulfide bond formation protein DsbA n=1 Tax=Oleiharenicola lentus TaxID=2508720 RepID=A0A4Q1C8M8_9BACT|nr:disulfide bond formation protein DsbA [Oleiharenicola lentus]RXK55304.1 disulfide bond formation protein DsbA [Oleiharenicola lentus]
MKVTYYLEVLSSWCHWAEPVWTELKRSYAGRVEFEWRIALMNPGDFPGSQAQCDWFYRRSGGTVMHSPYMLNSGWFEAERKGRYEAPNLVAEAARDFGFNGDEIRLALAHAALREGQKIGDLATAVKVAAKAAHSTGSGQAKIDPKKLLKAAESNVVKDRVATSTADFHAHQINQRPAFVLTDPIGDKAVFSGLVRIEPLAATIDAMLADSAAYAAHLTHHGAVPKV